jgi:hypothetical protein
MLRKHLIIGLLAVVASALWPASAHSGGVPASAAIQATARVEPSLGMVESGSIELTSPEGLVDYPEGSRLFWLYHPEQEGLRIQIQDESSELCCVLQSGSTAAGASAVGVSEDCAFASLVDLDQLTETGSSITVTLIYVNN